MYNFLIRRIPRLSLTGNYIFLHLNSIDDRVSNTELISKLKINIKEDFLKTDLYMNFTSHNLLLLEKFTILNINRDSDLYKYEFMMNDKVESNFEFICKKYAPYNINFELENEIRNDTFSKLQSLNSKFIIKKAFLEL
jgi:hypothetical protein